MQDNVFEFKLTPRQAREVAKQLLSASKTFRRKKQQNIDRIEVRVTTIDVQVHIGDRSFM